MMAFGDFTKKMAWPGLYAAAKRAADHVGRGGDTVAVAEQLWAEFEGDSFKAVGSRAFEIVGARDAAAEWREHE